MREREEDIEEVEGSEGVGWGRDRGGIPAKSNVPRREVKKGARGGGRERARLKRDVSEGSTSSSEDESSQPMSRLRLLPKTDGPRSPPGKPGKSLSLKDLLES